MKQTSKTDQRRREDYLEWRSVFAIVGGGLRWQKNDGGCCGSDCSSSSLCRGSSLCFPYLLLFWLLFPISLSLFRSPRPCVFSFSGMFCFSLSLSLSPLFSLVFLCFSLFFRFLSSIPFVLPPFLLFSFLFCFFVLAIPYFFIQSASFSLSFSMFLLYVFLLFLPFVSQSILPSISYPPLVFLCFLSNLPSLVFSFLSSNISSKSPPFCSLSPAIYKGEKGERGLLPQG